MKLTTLIVILFIMQVSANSFAQKITLNQKNAKLIDVFSEIRKQAGVDFIFNNSTLKDAKPVTIKVNQADLADVLDDLFKNQPLEYKIDANFVVISIKEKSFLDKVVDYFTALEVKGTVVDEKKSPMPGVSVQVKGSKQVAVTNGKGEFLLRTVPENSILLISYVGYITKEIPAASDLGYIILEAETAKLSEVEIVSKGYYETTREQATGSSSSIDSKTIERQPVLNLLASAIGRMPGVQITQPSGIPGAPFGVTIRGRNNFRQGGNEPLYIVDGVPISNDKVSARTATTGLFALGLEEASIGASPLSGINPYDIERIEVLKDADATAIYGSRGANGVVLITTKKGKPGKLKIAVDAFTGAGWAPLIKPMSTADYIKRSLSFYASEGRTPSSDPQDDGSAKRGYRSYSPQLSVWDTTRFTNWQKILIGNVAQSSSVQTSFSGGTKQTRMLLSMGYRRENSAFPNDLGFQNLSSHFSLNHRSKNDKFNAALTFSATNGVNNQLQIDLTNTALNMEPNAPAIYNADGSLNWENSTWVNPMARLEKTYNAHTQTLISNMLLSYRLAAGLEIKTNIGYTLLASKERNYLPSTAYDPAEGQTSMNNSHVLDSRGTGKNWIAEPQLSYEKKVGPGTLSTLAGLTFQEQQLERDAKQYSFFPSNDVLKQLSLAEYVVNFETTNTQYRYTAVFGRLNYNIKDKYILNLTGRRDGSSRFGPGSQFANFGGLGLAWNFVKEDWAEKYLKFLSFGKLRGSYGVTGNDQIGDYQYFDTYAGNIDLRYQGVPGLEPISLFNPNFRWETNRKMELALELGFLDDRINVTAGAYRNRSSNQLVQYTMPLTTGYGSILANLPATVQNRGLELEIASRNIEGKIFRWGSSFNISFPENKLIAFPNLENSSYASRYVIGRSLSIQKVFKYLGVDPATGIYRFADLNGDGQITNDLLDRQAIVDYAQPFYGGLENSFSYKNWNLVVFFQFVKQLGSNDRAVSSSTLDFVLDKKQWYKPGDVADLQRQIFVDEIPAGFSYNYNAALNWYPQSTGVATDASFIRCKNVALSYRLPDKTWKGLQGRLYFQAQNLFVLSRFEGFDPESQGTRLPPLRMFTAGFQLSL